MTCLNTGMTQDKNLHRAYALKTPDDSRALYGDWADTYDSDFLETNQYILHQNVAQAFVEAGGRGPVLDMGAGTGACGVALAALSSDQIHGTDISPQMLNVARDKGVYDTLFEGDILAGLPVPAGTYPGIVSSGTFTLGHVGPEGLDEVLRLLAPAGLAVIAVRDAHFDAAGFAAKLALLEPLLQHATQKKARIYAPGSGGDHQDDLAILLHLVKA